ncbi:MAG TPA: UDP-glucose 4-epimerase GalE [Porphyromonadaceae bacterium]|nr:UDP-glucose 4-epimerase GalE [Porphyromonadaceae bacterium]
MKQKILVTGGTGYIGSHTCVELINAGYEVVIIDNLSNSNIGVLDGIEAITGVRPVFVQGDCTDIATLTRLFEDNSGIKGIINFAASKAVGESVQKPLLYYRNNLNTLVNLLELMPRFGVEGIVFSSSCTVYGEPDVNPIDETAPIKPATSPYGNTKQISEEIIRDFVASGQPVKSIILRYFNPVGAHPSALIGELPLGVPNNLVPYLTQAAAGLRPMLTVFGDDYNTPDGSCIRDFIDVVDLAKAHVVAMSRMLDGNGEDAIEVFNLGTGKGVSVLELISSFRRATGVEVPYKIGPRRAGDIEKIWADPTKANTMLGWKAEVPIDETMRNAWAWQCHLMNK